MCLRNTQIISLFYTIVGSPGRRGAGKQVESDMKELVEADSVQESKVPVEQFSDADKPVITGLVITQCAFVFLQTMFFPGTGLIGSVIAGLCALMPWMATCSKGFVSRIFDLSVASLITSPLFGLFWSEVIAFYQRIL